MDETKHMETQCDHHQEEEKAPDEQCWFCGNTIRKDPSKQWSCKDLFGDIPDKSLWRAVASRKARSHGCTAPAEHRTPMLIYKFGIALSDAFLSEELKRNLDITGCYVYSIKVPSEVLFFSFGHSGFIAYETLPSQIKTFYPLLQKERDRLCWFLKQIDPKDQYSMHGDWRLIDAVASKVDVIAVPSEKDMLLLDEKVKRSINEEKKKEMETRAFINSLLKMEENCDKRKARNERQQWSQKSDVKRKRGQPISTQPTKQRKISSIRQTFTKERANAVNRAKRALDYKGCTDERASWKNSVKRVASGARPVRVSQTPVITEQTESCPVNPLKDDDWCVKTDNIFASHGQAKESDKEDELDARLLSEEEIATHSEEDFDYDAQRDDDDDVELQSDNQVALESEGDAKEMCLEDD